MGLSALGTPHPHQLKAVSSSSEVQRLPQAARPRSRSSGRAWSTASCGVERAEGYLEGTPCVELRMCRHKSQQPHRGVVFLSFKMGLWSGQHGNLQFLSPVAILVGAAVSSQVEDEKALGNSSAHSKERGDEVRTPTFQSKATAPCTGPGLLEDVLLMQAQEEGREEEGNSRTYSMSQGKGVPTQLECFYQVLRKVQKLEVGRSRRFSTCLIWFPKPETGSCRGRREKTAESQDSWRKGWGPRCPGPPGLSSWMSGGHRASWDQGSRVRLVGSLADQQPGLGTSEPVF